MKREVSNPFNKQLDWIFVQKRGKKNMTWEVITLLHIPDNWTFEHKP